MKWFNWFKKKDHHKEKIIAVKPVNFIGSYNSIRINKADLLYGGFAESDNEDKCFIITSPISPPCDMTINLDKFNLILIGIFKNCIYEDEDETIWMDIPILQLVELEDKEERDLNYSYDLLKKVFNYSFKNIEIVKS